MKTLLLVSLLCFLSVDAFSQSRRPPRFEDYPVKEKFRGKRARIDFRSCPMARRFRTMLGVAADIGPNFAGHYGVNSWGCGTECVQIGIVNLKNGKVYMPGFAASLDIETRAESRLLIINPAAKLKEAFGADPPPDDVYRTRYYVWQKDRLVYIYPAELKGKFQDILQSCEPR